MPECVASWIKNKDPLRIDRIQRELITVYENDFSRDNGKVNSRRILMVFRSIVSQLAKPNAKLIYGAARKGARARAREYEEAIEWLVSAGMLNRVMYPSPSAPCRRLISWISLSFLCLIRSFSSTWQV